MSDSGPFKSNFSRGRSSAGQFAIACVYRFFGTGVLSPAFKLTTPPRCRSTQACDSRCAMHELPMGG